MATTNEKLTQIFKGLAVFRELEGEGFKAVAYNNIAEEIQNLSKPVGEIDFTSLPGAGKSIREKVQEYLDTGTIKLFDQYNKKYPGLLELTVLDGVGPKKAFELWKKFKVRGLKDLQKKLKAGKIDKPKLLTAVDHYFEKQERVPRTAVLPKAMYLLKRIRKWAGVERAEFAGSMRRERESVRDVDIIVACAKGKAPALHKKFAKLATKKGAEVLASGDKKSRARLNLKGGLNIQVDFLTVDPSYFGAALLYFTGSKEHNVAMRSLAIQKGLKLNEYGLWKGKKRMDKPGLSEKSLYKKLGLAYHDPTHREGQRLMPK